MDVSSLTFPDLYQRLLDAGRLSMDADGRYFLDGEPVTGDGAAIEALFRKAAETVA